MYLLLGICFASGVANIAMLRAIQESGHPALAEMAAFTRSFGGKLPLLLEFALLLAAMLATASAYPVWGWLYVGYTLLNGVTTWLMLTGRM